MKQWYEDKLYARLMTKAGKERKIPLSWILHNKTITASVPEDIEWSNIQQIDFAPELSCAKAGDSGYYIIPHGRIGLGDSILCRFHERENAELVCAKFVMPMWGCIRPGKSYTAIVSSMTYEYQLVTSVNEGKYSCFARFVTDGKIPYEPIKVDFVLLEENADYSDAAIAYRKWRENRGEIIPYTYKIRNRPSAEYTAESVYVRIRQGWKPVPPTVLEQTPETEPPMHVAATFEDVSALLDQFAEHGIDKAEICLVGWNKSGHDGRWPQIFPVEEKLGGEEKLRGLIAKAKRMGYSIVGHTNSTDAYSIADIWNDTQLIIDENKAPKKNDRGWSGGDMYQICPVCGLRQAQKLLPQVRNLGFSGTHYIDVISTVFPRACYDPKHPVTRRQCVEQWNRILHFSRDLFGGISSEGTFDFTAPELDFGLYVSFGMNDCQLADECIPLWQLVYHGYVVSNPYSTTVNPTDKDLLTLLEYGGRPVFYYDSKFVTPTSGRSVNWMGENDIHCHTPEDRATSAAFIAKVARWYRKISYLQMIPMKRHTIRHDKIHCVEYENGDVVLVDYQEGNAFLNGKQVLPINLI